MRRILIRAVGDGRNAKMSRMLCGMLTEYQH
jgi:hypothetical protein